MKNQDDSKYIEFDLSLKDVGVGGCLHIKYPVQRGIVDSYASEEGQKIKMQLENIAKMCITPSIIDFLNVILFVCEGDLANQEKTNGGIEEIRKYCQELREGAMDLTSKLMIEYKK